jgi:hypothetical protein
MRPILDGNGDHLMHKRTVIKGGWDMNNDPDGFEDFLEPIKKWLKRRIKLFNTKWAIGFLIAALAGMAVLTRNHSSSHPVTTEELVLLGLVALAAFLMGGLFFSKDMWN